MSKKKKQDAIARAIAEAGGLYAYNVDHPGTWRRIIQQTDGDWPSRGSCTVDYDGNVVWVHIVGADGMHNLGPDCYPPDAKEGDVWDVRTNSAIPTGHFTKPDVGTPE